ncbi:ABC transporter permease [Candidatus Leptofilum sp.]|uniref:ABC transporter permease n=1 Tax=Candidatus Leptofilum sp. TaxID=3241576 RepID=UPI003B59F7BD
MTELAQEPITKKKNFIQRLRENPVTVKELRSRMRGRRAFVVLTVHLLVMSGFIALVYSAFASAASGPFGPDSREVGKVVFSSVLGLQVMLVIFVGPSFTAGAISGEKERQTYDLLRTTLLSAKSFVAGKLVSALSYVLLLIFVAIPLQSIAFLMGGVAVIELVLSQIIVLVSAMAFALWGLYASARMRTTLSASVVTFAGALFVTVGIPVIVGLFSMILGPFLFGATYLTWTAEAALMYVLLFLAATNLPATLIVSDIVLVEEGSLWYFSTVVGGASGSSHTIWLFSPWPLFLILYILLSVILFYACVRRVRKIATQ